MTVPVVDVDTCFGRRCEFDYDLSLEALLRALDERSVAAALSYSLRDVCHVPGAGSSETVAAALTRPSVSI